MKDDLRIIEAIERELRSLDLTAEDRSAVVADIGRRLGRARADAVRSKPIVAAARRIHKARLRANSRFGHRMISDPRFEMLLGLFITHEEGRPVSVGDACLFADVPQTTALRHLEKLDAMGLLTRVPDGRDRRRSLVEPTSEALSRMSALMEDYLRSP